MALLDLVSLPVRLTVGAAHTTLALGRLVAPEGPVRRPVQLVALGQTLERMQPRVTELLALVPALHESVDALYRAVEPLSELAIRIPGGRRRSALEA
jgi:hypothetical protein